MGVALFKRTPKGLLLTDAAQTALPALREAFDRLAEAASLLTAAVDGRRLTLTAPPSFAAKWLVPRLKRLRGGLSAGRRLALRRHGASSTSPPARSISPSATAPAAIRGWRLQPADAARR